MVRIQSWFSSSSLKMASAAFALAFFFCACAGAQVVQTYDFEDGTTQGWQAFIGTAPVNSTAAAYSGTHSLLTSTSSGGAGGPSIPVTTVLQAGAKYTITGWVMLTSGEAATNANFTMRRSDPTCSGGTCYDTIGSYKVPVTSTGWAQIGGSFTATTTETALTLYAQLVGATTQQSFYLDDVVITQTAPPPGGTPIVAYNFANGSTDGWGPFGSVQVTSTPPPILDPAGDADALLTTNRTATYMGPSIDLAGVNGIVAGATYQVTAYVLLANADASNPTVTLSLKRTDCAGTTYSNIVTSSPTSNPLSTTAWAKVQGTFAFSDLPGAPSSLVLYAQSSSATDSFYLAHVTINQLTPAPPNPSQQDNSGITSTFEDGGLDGWGSRSGSSTLTNTTAAAHSGTHSLLVTNRIANWDGPSIAVTNKMYVGSVYNLSVWVMLQPTDGSTHTVNMSLQATYQGTTSYPGVTSYPGISIPADGAWHQIVVNNYTMGTNSDPGTAVTLYLQTVTSNGSNDLVGFYVDDFQLSYVAPPTIQTDIPSMWQTYASDFPIGTAVDSTDLSGPHRDLLTMHYNSITSGNEMKWQSVESSKGSFNWGPADAEVGEAVCHNIRIRGHNLVWATGAQTPSYAFGDGTNSVANQATVTANIQEHIQAELQHFGSKVYAWDVVNEPLDPSQSDCLVHGPFYKVLGAEYLDIAFKAARQYAPNAKLFLNDYSTADPNRLACLVKVVGELRDRGVPIDGIGHEMHNAINYPSPAAMANAIDTIAQNLPGILQQVTELDESVYNAGDRTSNYGSSIPASVLAEQGWLYKAYFDVFKSRAQSGELSAITMWGMADDDTWLDSFPVSRTDYPLPFDMKLQAKPAYWGIVDPSHLPGYGMTFSLSAVPGTIGRTRVFTITATNGDVGPAYATQIKSLTFTQIAGKSCTPTLTSASGLTVALGDIPTSGSASATFNVDFSGCEGVVRFTVSAPWSSAVYDTGTFSQTYQYPESQSPPISAGGAKQQ